ncbi:glucokinase [Motilibacter rhizosphaerae]|uniref:Glucokinase n=1 Tax=Motilibacter rhizosphaerae TaxID=598652 RepID=A0A4Q7NRC9_9ACTN|nr:ROK family glucokinase [Motilibacter rhizosphaerae]RZS89535.1 glucokinase [Motilibacter rhizosphaerae]
MGLTIGVDLGGTKVAAAVVDEEGRIHARTRQSTPATGADATIGAILGAVRELREQHPDVEAVCVAAPGFIDEQRATVLFLTNLGGWRHRPLKHELEQALGLPVVIENDANAAAWGEAHFGAGRGETEVVCVTVGTGIGGGIILGGQLFRGRFGVAAEVGHYRVEPNGRPCGCGNRGCWEQYTSGNALVREARWRAAEDRPGAALLLSYGDGSPEGVEGLHVTDAARKGDPVAIASFESVGRWLGQGLADLAAILDPACFVIGGGVSEAGDLLLEPARRTYAEVLTGRAYRPLAQIRQATLGNDAGVVGAADLARV